MMVHCFGTATSTNLLLVHNVGRSRFLLVVVRPRDHWIDRTNTNERVKKERAKQTRTTNANIHLEWTLSNWIHSKMNDFHTRVENIAAYFAYWHSSTASTATRQSHASTVFLDARWSSNGNHRSCPCKLKVNTFPNSEHRTDTRKRTDMAGKHTHSQCLSACDPSARP